MSGKTRQVEDINGRCYRLSRLLGRGGQGEVYAVEGGRLAAKLVRFDRSSVRREHLRQRLAFVRRLPLDDLPIARPLEMLRSPHLGYVMELLTGMKPLLKLVRPPKEVRSLTGWYIESGGLQQRLSLLARCAEVLSRLRSKGLVYGDLSPNNVFVSSSPESGEVCLIDADNLCYQSSPSTPNLYTRGYGAPEVVTDKSGVNSLTDAYSFAVLAFETLSLVHPFMGDYVDEGEPELEDQALEGLLPWIDHPDDDRNRSSHGIPRKIVLSPRLEELSKRALVDGQNDPLERPGVAEWAERLYVAADFTLNCRTCKGSYYYKTDKCPWCDSPRSPYALLKATIWSPEREMRESLRRKPVAGLSLTIPGTAVLKGRIATGRTDQEAHVPRVEIRFLGLRQHIGVRSLDGNAYRLVSDDGQRQEEVHDQMRPFPHSWQLHLGPMDKPHRVVTFEMHQGSSA
jgi:DNA-binding helix-hairpin-helix protein with protein kinase domain